MTQKLHKNDADAKANGRSKSGKSAGGSGTLGGNKARAKMTQKLHKSDAGMTAKSRTEAPWLRKRSVRCAHDGVHAPGVGHAHFELSPAVIKNVFLSNQRS